LHETHASWKLETDMGPAAGPHAARRSRAAARPEESGTSTSDRDRGAGPLMRILTKSSEPAYEVRWLVSPRHDALGASSVVAGLGALAGSGELRLHLAALRSATIEPHVFRFEVDDLASGETRRVALEVFDRADRFDRETLRDVDVYFKQTLDAGPVEDLPDEWRARVRPAGLTFATRVAGTRSLVARSALASCTAWALSHGGRGTLRTALRRIREGVDIAGTLPIEDWERSPADEVLHEVVYQTRLWPPEPGHDVDRRAVNQGRIDMVRALRAEFGGPERIGVIHSDFAAAEAPDTLLSRKVSRREYARQLRTSLISVNTHGLDGSPGFKIGESLAAGAAMVSQPFRFELPEPLRPDVHYLPFTTPDECVTQCRRLLDDHDLAERLRSENLRYYHRFVRPEAHVRNLLAWAFA